MTTNYDPIAEQYQRSKQQPWRTFIECFTLMELMGDPRGIWRCWMSPAAKAFTPG